MVTLCVLFSISVKQIELDVKFKLLMTRLHQIGVAIEIYMRRAVKTNLRADFFGHSLFLDEYIVHIQLHFSLFVGLLL